MATETTSTGTGTTTYVVVAPFGPLVEASVWEWVARSLDAHGGESTPLAMGIIAFAALKDTSGEIVCMMARRFHRHSFGDVPGWNKADRVLAALFLAAEAASEYDGPAVEVSNA